MIQLYSKGEVIVWLYSRGPIHSHSDRKVRLNYLKEIETKRTYMSEKFVCFVFIFITYLYFVFHWIFAFRLLYMDFFFSK